ncbi:MAG: alpha-glucuronidase family glycosyl hydrolase [Microscillaceae bacterium]|nr:alpha-glucuronidase family glycosyl hydrolase [Microscillaceae bacterium]
MMRNFVIYRNAKRVCVYTNLLLCFFIAVPAFNSYADDGYKLWLRYEPISEPAQKAFVQKVFAKIVLNNSSPTFSIIQAELVRAGQGMLGFAPSFSQSFAEEVTSVIGTPADFLILRSEEIKKQLLTLGAEGYYIAYHNFQNKKYLIIAANQPVGVLYGTFHLLRYLQSGNSSLLKPIIEFPKIKNRILNHWDNLDRTVERGYAGFSIWDWHKLPDYVDPRYIEYARANASIGINGTVLTNVNANALVLSPEYIEKVKALADVFRPYGLKVYLTARFSAPIEIGALKTADPLVPEVRAWWKNKVDELYRSIPDFGGFLVKANSEGQPGPQNYNRSHADGANMLAEAVAPYGGIVMWRAFVYSHEVPEDRAKQANNEFEPLDGKFQENVFIQVKNGAIDFQPREPFHPLFGKMPKTPLALELQITQEYLGQATNLVYLAPLFKECLDADTYAQGKGSTVAKIIDGSLYQRNLSAIAGVANIGTDRNWTGHLFGQSNWYAFGRLAWNHELSSAQIAEEWTRLTFGNSPDVIQSIRKIMLDSREAVVNYSTPLGLHHLMGKNHHYGPGPWVSEGRPDWTSVYYHQADSLGIGFDRTAKGSNALSQYAPEVAREFANLQTCPEKYLLWFHHLPWDYKMKSGNTLWKELCLKYEEGLRTVIQMEEAWNKLGTQIDTERYEQVRAFLKIQEKEAKWWKNSCLLYFQQFSKQTFPTEIEKPQGDIEKYMNQKFPHAPGIKPSW